MAPRLNLAALSPRPPSRPTKRRVATSTPWLAAPPPGPPRPPRSSESSHGSSRAGAPPPPPPPNEGQSTIILAPEPPLLSSETGLVVSPPTLLPYPDAYPDAHFCPWPPPAPQLPFSTSRFVNALERRSGGTLNRGVSRAIMEVTRDLLVKEERRVANESWRKGDLENSTYLFQAALAELKTSSQIKQRNDSIILRSMTASLQRDTDAISQRLKESMHELRSAIQLEIHVRKEETSAELKILDRAIMDLNSKFNILLGETRTEQESLKWVSTRRVLGALVILVVGVVVAATLPRSSSDSAADAAAPPTVEELGVIRRDGIEADVATNWFWPGGGRVGEDGEGEMEVDAAKVKVDAGAK